MMIPELPYLAVLPVRKLIPHEHHDLQRARPLVEKLRASGVLRNPPVVTQLQDRSGRYMVLDGANRVTALQEMGIAHIPVQVIQMDDPNLRLNTWNHVTWNLKPSALLRGLEEIPDVTLEPLAPEAGQGELSSERTLTVIHLADNRVYAARMAAVKIKDRVNQLNSIVNSYKDRASMDRTSLRSIEPLLTVYPHLSGLLIFPQFYVDEVAFLAGAGVLLPSGITRFAVSPRVLRINYPLKELEKESPLKQKNERLQRWIRERLAEKAVRYYAEPTFLFDE